MFLEGFSYTLLVCLIILFRFVQTLFGRIFQKGGGGCRVLLVSCPWPIISTIAVILRLEHSRPKVLKIVNFVNTMYYNLQFNKSYSTAINL